MPLFRFELFSPVRLDEAVALLKEKGKDAFVMAGGTRITSYNVCYTKLLRTPWIKS